jgi:hypothetical protein
MIDAFTASFLLACFVTLCGMTLGLINFNDTTRESQ